MAQNIIFGIDKLKGIPIDMKSVRGFQNILDYVFIGRYDSFITKEYFSFECKKQETLESFLRKAYRQLQCRLTSK
jgi:hypothetical protein